MNNRRPRQPTATNVTTPSILDQEPDVAGMESSSLPPQAGIESSQTTCTLPHSLTVRQEHLTMKAQHHMKASTRYQIPYTTLNEWCLGKRSSYRHGKTIFSSLEEESLINWVTDLYKMSRCVPMRIIGDKLQEIVADGQAHPFRLGRPSKTWKKTFFCRHKLKD